LAEREAGERAKAPAFNPDTSLDARRRRLPNRYAADRGRMGDGLAEAGLPDTG
jgi:hypothetical protein